MTNYNEQNHRSEAPLQEVRSRRSEEGTFHLLSFLFLHPLPFPYPPPRLPSHPVLQNLEEFLYKGLASLE